MVQLPYKTTWTFLKKLKLELTYHLATPPYLPWGGLERLNYLMNEKHKKLEKVIKYIINLVRISQSQYSKQYILVLVHLLYKIYFFLQ